jgi:hypothetical protein
MHWWFWMLWLPPTNTYRSFGMVQETNREAYQLEHRLRMDYSPSYVARWVWDGRRWVHDQRSFFSDFFAEAHGMRPDRYA